LGGRRRFRLGIESELGECRGDRRLRDAQPHAISRDRHAAHRPAVADAGATGKLLPAAVAPKRFPGGGKNSAKKPVEPKRRPPSLESMHRSTIGPGPR
jgi:hypothetical protein